LRGVDPLIPWNPAAGMPRGRGPIGGRGMSAGACERLAADGASVRDRCSDSEALILFL
jgi:hypothetical protein